MFCASILTLLHSGAPTADPRYEVVVDRQEEGLRNVLVIHDADTHDFGAYNCSVVNEYGVARKQIRLNEESECSPKTPQDSSFLLSYRTPLEPS